MISPARKSALTALQEFRKTGILSAPQCKRTDDSSLAECILHGVLQNERFLDACLSEYLSGLSRLHPRILDILRLSAFQILLLDRVPVSAAVNDAVSICRNTHFSYASGMVNAVLRRLSEQKAFLLKKEYPMAVRYSHPDWLVERLEKQQGTECVKDYLAANQIIPNLKIQINVSRIHPDEYIHLLEQNGFRPLEINRDLHSVLLKRCDVSTLPGYREGFFYVQDDAARTAVKIAEIKPGMSILDVCAAPGGKSIAAALDGGEVLSCDLKPDRLETSRQNFDRLRLQIPTVQMDATVFCEKYLSAFDVVIADVPCTGTGVIRKHPEIRFKTEQQLLALLPLQRRILEIVSEYVKPGGILLYSTCSVLQEEDEMQIQNFLKNRSDFHLEPVKESDTDYYRSWPQHDGNDGFFAAKLRKRIE